MPYKSHRASVLFLVKGDPKIKTVKGQICQFRIRSTRDVFVCLLFIVCLFICLFVFSGPVV